MSNNTDHRDDDQRLTDAYRAVANERAPDYLNEKVLRLAASRRTPYFRARTWTRPLAWAATIGLSLAIVLEMTRVPQVEPDSIGIAAPGSLETDDRRREIGTTLDESHATEKAVIAPQPAEMDAQTMDAKRARPSVPSADRLSSEKFVPTDISVFRDAEEMARTRAGSDAGPAAQRPERKETAVDEDVAETTGKDVTQAQATSTGSSREDEGQAENGDALASFAARSASESPVALRHCGESVRSQPDSWIACIRELEESGQEDEARSEYEEFRRAFPDFDTRDADK